MLDSDNSINTETRVEMPEAWTAAQLERDLRDEPEMLAAIAAMNGKCIMHPEFESDGCPICFPIDENN